MGTETTIVTVAAPVEEAPPPVVVVEAPPSEEATEEAIREETREQEIAARLGAILESCRVMETSLTRLAETLAALAERMDHAEQVQEPEAEPQAAEPVAVPSQEPPEQVTAGPQERSRGPILAYILGR